MIHLLRKLTPKPLLSAYHFFLTYLAALWYGYPSKKMIVIGITGTHGKSTTALMITRILQEAGEKVGLSGTILFNDGEKEWLNDAKMTMVGRFRLQKLLKTMVNNQCTYAVVETTSEGIKQHRHRAINYDAVIFTNLTPGHVEAHGGFEHYKHAKGKLFSHLAKSKEKTLAGKKIKKCAIINLDDPHADYFLEQSVPCTKIGFTLGKVCAKHQTDQKVSGKYTEHSVFEHTLQIKEKTFAIKLPGAYNGYNALAAVVCTNFFGIETSAAQRALENIASIPGRCELIPNSIGATIIVDQAPDPASIAELYGIVKQLHANRIIHVFGSAGGGRDKARRPILGKMIAKHADHIILTDEDPYDEDPVQIVKEIQAGVFETWPSDDPRLQIIMDRKAAIHKALELASHGDVVLITGKGTEQAIITANRTKIPWDDRKVVAEILNSLTK